MKLRVLGCAGGIGGNARTASFLLDDDVLIEAGTGVGELGLSELMNIDHVFVTHSHLDHIACLPLLIDSVGSLRQRPITVYGLPETLEALRCHIFNWQIWPDFTRIPNSQKPFMCYREITLGEAVCLSGRRIVPLPAAHVLPAVGYQLDSGRASLVYSGDTTICDAFWSLLNRIENLRYLIIETAFPDEEIEVARLSKHLCPSMLRTELYKMQREAEVFITHLKPGKAELTMSQIQREVSAFSPKMLLNNQIFEF